MGKTLLQKVWDLHRVRRLPTGQDQLFIGLHLIHEVTTPQAFQMLKEAGRKVLMPERTFATADHIVPTDDLSRPFRDPLAEAMMEALERNVRMAGIRYFDRETGRRGIVHIIGPELGLTQPGMTVACGDSHTSTHGALGAVAFGIGTSQVRDVLATQTVAMSQPKVRRIEIRGPLAKGVGAKDVILKLIATLGINGGLGYAYEYGGPTVEAMDIEARLTLCNMSIEGGARMGYVNPDLRTIEYLRDRPFAPQGPAFERAVSFWKALASDAQADYDDSFVLQTDGLQPMVTWGTNPGQAVGVKEPLPRLKELRPEEREAARQTMAHMGFKEGQPLEGERIDVAFIGSCTNGRITDLREAARVAGGRKKAPHVRALVVPGSMTVARQAEEEGLKDLFLEAGFEWRSEGCSMCLGMNPDCLAGRQISASTSNRNFIGRQGSPQGRTLLMSPAMAAAAAVSGAVVDVRDY